MGNLKLGTKLQNIAQYCDCLESFQRFQINQQENNKPSTSEIDEKTQQLEKDIQDFSNQNQIKNKTSSHQNQIKNKHSSHQNQIKNKPSSHEPSNNLNEKVNKSLKQRSALRKSPHKARKQMSYNLDNLQIKNKQEESEFSSDLNEYSKNKLDKRTRNTTGIEIIKLEELPSYSYQHDSRYLNNQTSLYKSTQIKNPFRSTLSILKKQADLSEGEDDFRAVEAEQIRRNIEKSNYFVDLKDSHEYDLSRKHKY